MNHTFYYSRYNTVLLCILIVITSACLYAITTGSYLPIAAPNTESTTSNQTITTDNTPIPNTETSALTVSGTGASDLVSFSVAPGQTVSGSVTITGQISGGYFFEGSMPFEILDSAKNKIPVGPGHASTADDWMTAGPVAFSATVDFSTAPHGPAYIRITQDDPSGGESGHAPRFVLVPIVIQ